MTTQVDLGHGRGWASPTAAASILRIDRQLGRLADINEAGRSPEKANENRRKWLAYERYLNGGPWAPKAPFALGAEDSVHCSGDAADSDDWYDPAAAAVWRANGWRQTALYPHNLAKHEPWHGEHFVHLDTHRFDPVPATPATVIPEEEPEMQTIKWGEHIFTLDEMYLKHETNTKQASIMGWLFNRNDRMTKGSTLIGVDNEAVNALQKTLSIPWYAFDLVMSGRGFNIDGTRGDGTGENGRVWSLLHEMNAKLDGIRIDTSGLAQSLDDITKKINDAGKGTK
ncbi:MULTISPECIES: hypothetical protein [unclassified Microbacterium]|uniref:hypothetical protein n=1 Tax=unclassified Microbacterium TaxID=2609290 RepID=UPI003466E900